MRVVVDYDVCASTGSCMQVCPEVFEVRSDGYLYVLQEEPGEELRAKVRRRRPSCARRAPSPSRSEPPLSRPDSGWTEMMPGSRRSSSIRPVGTASVVASTMTAEPGVGVRPTSMSAMLTPAWPSAVPTTPIMPGRSSLRTTSMLVAGRDVGRVVVEADDAGLAPPAAEGAGDLVAAAADRDEVHVVDRRRARSTSRISTPCSLARVGAFT